MLPCCHGVDGVDTRSRMAYLYIHVIHVWKYTIGNTMASGPEDFYPTRSTNQIPEPGDEGGRT